ncbi:uncharacterized protein LOC116414501, partial [Apis florea]|uniref:uncharacterized protein LOC116414501 n=1 Tax=Apis florea TaxID=7463 RepID=UPI0012FEED6C
SCPAVKPFSSREFSYQNLSPRRRLLNCWPIIQANVGPTKPPFTDFSAIPPVNRSMSSTDEYTDLNLLAVDGGIAFSKSSKFLMGDRAQGCRQSTYGGIP